MRCLKLLKLFGLGTLYHVKNTVLARVLEIVAHWDVLVNLHLALVRVPASYLGILHWDLVHCACDLVVLE